MDLNYIIGIDIGTTNIKGSLYSSNGDLITNASINYEYYSPKENYHEQDPDHWVSGFIAVLKRLLIKNTIKKNLQAISLSTQGGTFVPVDKNYNPLCRAITWLDRRSLKLLNNNKELLAKNIEFYNKTGWRLDSNISFMPLYWLKENKKEIFNKIHKILYVNDYVQKKITNKNYQDPSNASITLFYNVIDGRWDQDILNLIGFGRDKFSEVKETGEFVGYLNGKTCEELNIENKVKIINGAHDQYCVAIGAGIINENETLLSTGTSWAIFKMLKQPLFDSKRFFAIGRNVTEDRFGLIYSILAAGASLKWFANNIMNFDNEAKLLKIMDENAEILSKIRNHIIFYPYLTGEFAPDFNINKKAAFLGLEIGHNYLDFIKAIMEGIGFQLKKIFTVLEKRIEIGNIKMVGGGVKSKIWPQMLADIMDLNIMIPKYKDEDFATKGAAIIAGYGSGMFSSIEEGSNRLRTEFKTIKSNTESAKFYKNKFKIFLQEYYLT